MTDVPLVLPQKVHRGLWAWTDNLGRAVMRLGFWLMFAGSDYRLVVSRVPPPPPPPPPAAGGEAVTLVQQAPPRPGDWLGHAMQ